jgi:single-strand DNA-binding protein
MINKVILIGNLGKDPEVRHLENNSAVAKFSVATNESYKDKSGEWQNLTEWHDVVAWRYLAQLAERDLKKGSQVYVEGKLTHRKYQDKDGIDRYVTEVVAQILRPLDRRDSGSRDDGSFPTALDQPAYGGGNSNTNTSKEKVEDIIDDIPNDDLPF